MTAEAWEVRCPKCKATFYLTGHPDSRYLACDTCKYEWRQAVAVIERELRVARAES